MAPKWQNVIQTRKNNVIIYEQNNERKIDIKHSSIHVYFEDNHVGIPLYGPCIAYFS